MTTAPVSASEPLTSVGPDDLVEEAAVKLGLTEHLQELDTVGYTVVPPEKVASSEFLDALRDAVLATHERRSQDARILPRMKMVHAAGAGEQMMNVLWEDPIFETALMNPVVQTLARALVGNNCRVSMFDAVVKPKGGGTLPFHTDTEMTEPYPPAPQVCNITYALTDYSPEDGSTVFVPGSHRLQRQPHSGEIDGDFSKVSVAGSLRIPKPVAVTARAGSLVAWTGAMWHSAVPRSTEGERVSLLMYFSRWYLQTIETFRGHVPEGALDRNNARFAQLLDIIPGWALKDPVYAFGDIMQAATGRAVYPILDVPRP